MNVEAHKKVNKLSGSPCLKGCKVSLRAGVPIQTTGIAAHPPPSLLGNKPFHNVVVVVWDPAFPAYQSLVLVF